jgi:predicted RNase H-like HicB family nuclease
MVKEYKFSVVIEPAEEGGYFAECPALPGCASQGETYAEAVANIQDAIKGSIASLVAHGEAVPFEEEPRRRFKVELPVSLPA